jgi:steroid 5-alpha reductase family enzyme
VYYGITIAFYSVGTFGAELHPRMAIIAALVWVWGSRLTYNFFRKGGYALTGEDYRWKIIQQGVHPILFQIFNIVFIAFIQNVLLASILSPVYVAWTASYNARNNMTTPLNEIDYLAAALALTCLLIEAVADQQQWNFQTAKYAAINAGKRLTGPYAKGFIDTGLFKYSRHPNFFAEQCFWWSLCLFATAATGRWTGWWMGGAAALSALFQGSTWLTEKITAEKYSKYKEYQQTTSRLMLWFPGKASTGGSTAARSPAAAVKSPRGRRASAPAVAAAAAPAPVEEVAVADAAAATAPAPRGRSTTRRASAPAKKPAASRSRSAPAKKAAPKKAASAPAKKPAAAARSASRGAATKKTAAAAPKKAAASPARRTTRSRA